jgi:hypothetical protein
MIKNFDSKIYPNSYPPCKVLAVVVDEEGQLI